MNIIQINATYNIGSTGKIMAELDDVINNSGYNGYMACGYYNPDNSKNVYFTNSKQPNTEIKKNILVSRITGKMGYRKKHDTVSMIDWMDSINPDVVHLHNIHGDWLHIETLFTYLKEKRLPVVWTLHDCWAFTGRCSHFEMCGCNKWKSECHSCTNNKVYPITYFFDYSRQMFRDKKKWFLEIKDMTIVTPSHWLASYVKESYLGCYPVKVIHNGINTDVFSPTGNLSKYYSEVKEKKIILAVASSWSQTKGFDDIIRLDSLIDHDKYQIVIVGLNSRQMKAIPDTIIGVSRTNNQQELVELYSGAYVFVNLTYQDNFPTTNLEALSCSLPIITYQTGGSPEAVVGNEGFVIEKGNVVAVLDAIEHVNTVDRSLCRRIAIQRFNKYERYHDYIELYDRLMR